MNIIELALGVVIGFATLVAVMYFMLKPWDRPEETRRDRKDEK